MRVSAKHWICYNGQWYKRGDVFEAATTDMDELSDMVNIVETPISAEPKEDTEQAKPALDGEKPRRGRPRKG